MSIFIDAPKKIVMVFNQATGKVETTLLLVTENIEESLKDKNCDIFTDIIAYYRGVKDEQEIRP